MEMKWERLLALIDELERESRDILKTLQKVIFLIDLLYPREKYTYEQAFLALIQVIETNQAIRDIAKENTEPFSSTAALPLAGESAKTTSDFCPTDFLPTYPCAGPTSGFYPTYPCAGLPGAPQASASVGGPPSASSRPYGTAASSASTQPNAFYVLPSAPPPAYQSVEPQAQMSYGSQSGASSATELPPGFGKQSPAPSAPRPRDEQSQMSGTGLFHRFRSLFSRSPRQSGTAQHASDMELKKVDFSAVAPKVFVKGGYTDIKVIMYEEAYRHAVDEMIEEGDKEVKSGIQKARDGSEIKVVLSSENIPINNNTQVRTWQGGYLNFTFAVFLPIQYSLPGVAFRADVYINNVIATNLVFTAQCSTLQEQKISVARNDILSAFVSYAHEDRIRVAAIVQGMQKARPDLDIFFDVNNIRSGEYWKKVLFREIETRDILFLCWSHFASQSEWVDEEWRHAYFQKGLSGIEPIPIDPPEVCPPPDELKDKHFNDMLLYFINAESGK